MAAPSLPVRSGQTTAPPTVVLAQTSSDDSTDQTRRHPPRKKLKTSSEKATTTTTKTQTITITLLPADIKGNLAQLSSAAQKAGSSFVIDTKCAPGAGKVYSIMGKKAAMLQQCKSNADCSSSVMYAEVIQQADEAATNKERTAWLSRLDSYFNMGRAVGSKHVLEITASWFCEDSQKHEYKVNDAWLGPVRSKKMRGEGLTAFCTAEIPKGYQLWTLRDFMRSYTDPSKSSLMGLRTLYNVASTSWSWRIVENRYVESGMLDLTKKMIDAGTMPDYVSPEMYGVLIKIKKTKGDSGDENIIPVILPVPKLAEYRVPPTSTLIGDALLLAVRAKIFNSVISGFMDDGALSAYKPSRNALKKIAWAGAITYAVAVLLTYMEYLPYNSSLDTGMLGHTVAGSVSSVNNFILDALNVIKTKSLEISADVERQIPFLMMPSDVSGDVDAPQRPYPITDEMLKNMKKTPKTTPTKVLNPYYTGTKLPDEKDKPIKYYRDEKGLVHIIPRQNVKMSTALEPYAKYRTYLPPVSKYQKAVDRIRRGVIRHELKYTNPKLRPSNEAMFVPITFKSDEVSSWDSYFRTGDSLRHWAEYEEKVKKAENMPSFWDTVLRKKVAVVTPERDQTEPAVAKHELEESLPPEAYYKPKPEPPSSPAKILRAQPFRFSSHNLDIPEIPFISNDPIYKK